MVQKIKKVVHAMRQQRTLGDPDNEDLVEDWRRETGIVPPAAQPLVDINVRHSPDDHNIITAKKLLLFFGQIMEGMRPPLVFSKEVLCRVVENGETEETIEATVIAALAMMKTVWRESPKEKNTPIKNDFIATVSQYRHDSHCALFGEFIIKLKALDNSKDPINLPATF
jgi:hypothetical protein